MIDFMRFFCHQKKLIFIRVKCLIAQLLNFYFQFIFIYSRFHYDQKYLVPNKIKTLTMNYSPCKEYGKKPFYKPKEMLVFNPLLSIN